jgi:hypothetical protein
VGVFEASSLRVTTAEAQHTALTHRGREASREVAGVAGVVVGVVVVVAVAAVGVVVVEVVVDVGGVAALLPVRSCDVRHQQAQPLQGQNMLQNVKSVDNSAMTVMLTTTYEHTCFRCV